MTQSPHTLTPPDRANQRNEQWWAAQYLPLEHLWCVHCLGWILGTEAGWVHVADLRAACTGGKTTASPPTAAEVALVVGVRQGLRWQVEVELPSAEKTEGEYPADAARLPGWV